MDLANKIKSLMVLQGYDIQTLSAELGITPKTLYTRFKNNNFKYTELLILVDILKIEDPEAIFFPNRVSRGEHEKAVV